MNNFGPHWSPANITADYVKMKEWGSLVRGICLLLFIEPLILIGFIFESKIVFKCVCASRKLIFTVFFCVANKISYKNIVQTPSHYISYS